MRCAARVLAIVATAGMASLGATAARAGPPEYAGTIRVRLEGMTADELERATVEVVTRSRRFRYDRLPLLLTKGGWFVAGTAAFARAYEHDDCELVIDHPEFETERRPLLMPRRLDGTVPPDVLRIDSARLERATVVTGRVIDRYPVHVDVALFSVGGPEPRSTSQTDPDGFYSLKVPREWVRPDLLVEVVATPARWAPVSADIALAARGVVKAPDLVVEESITLGRVDVEGIDAEKAQILATWLGEPASEHRKIPRSSAEYVGSRWQRAGSGAHPTVAGWFGLPGLAPGPWRVRLIPDGSRTESRVPVHPDLLVARTAIVSIPRDEIRFGAPSRTITWTVEASSGPVCAAVVAVDGEHGRLLLQTGFRGEVVARLRADRELDVVVEAGGCKPARERVAPGGDESRTLHLDDGDAKRAWFPSVDGIRRVEIVGTDGLPIPVRARIVSGGDGRPRDRFLEQIDLDTWIEWYGMLSPRGGVHLAPGSALVVGSDPFERKRIQLPDPDDWFRWTWDNPENRLIAR